MSLLGLAGAEPTDGSQFLGRIQYDTRVGFWTIVKRAMGSDGRWADQKSEPFKSPSFLIDLGTLEVGWSKITVPPVFILVPYGSDYPLKPQETVAVDQAKFQQAFRAKVCSPKTFGDSDIYYWGGNSKTIVGSMHDLMVKNFPCHPEAVAGKIPVVTCPTLRSVPSQGGGRSSTFYAPVWEIVGWQERLPVFGPRTVPAPTQAASEAAQKAHEIAGAANGGGGPGASAPPPGHVPPPGATKGAADSEGMPF